MFLDEFRDVAEVSYPGESGIGCGGRGFYFEDEADGVVGVVRDGEVKDFEIFEMEGGSGLENLPIELTGEVFLDGLGGLFVCVEGEFWTFTGEAADADGVIGVFVG